MNRKREAIFMGIGILAGLALSGPATHAAGYQNCESHHVVVVVGKTDEYIKITESGTNNHVRWGGQYFRWWLEEQPHYISYTRYLQ